MGGSICIHGHCYQPPRLDPWLEEFLAEPSAAPYLNWNERICRECYSPMAWARRMDQGRILDITNCYEWISFNFGPTLLTWMESYAPQTYARILAGDRRSVERLGHGNAIAQVFHHVIMPLSTDKDRDIEIAWSIQDFERRFKRMPEGMWLAETAVDEPTLEALARAGILFTVLAPRQARAVATLDGSHAWPVDETTLDTSTPYYVNLPSGKQIAVFFYNGALSRAVAFERLLADGEAFFQRVAAHTGPGLCSLATDGESYGHHFTFGEMALAYAIHRMRTDDNGYGLTNYAAWLETHPPTQSVRIHEKSSWSCIHGVERWKSDCGCSDGGHPEWKQHWRQPLRRALNFLRYYVDAFFLRQGKTIFVDSSKALLAYGKVLSGAQSMEVFLAEHCRAGSTIDEKKQAHLLVEMERWSLASFASCAWFFDDLGRIEPVNALACALRSLEVFQQAGGRDVTSGLLEILEEARSNDPAKGDGVHIWKTMVQPRSMHALQVALLAVAIGPAELVTPAVKVTLEERKDTEEGGAALARIFWKRTGRTQAMAVQWTAGELAGLQLEDEQGNHIALNDLDERSRGYLCKAKARETTAAMWTLEMTNAQHWACLTDRFSEGQSEPIGIPGAILPGLLWIWVTGGVRMTPYFTSYLKRFVGENRYISTMVADFLQKSILTLLQEEPLSVEVIIPMITRARDVGIEPSWWDVQNRVWEVRKAPGMEALSRWIGMDMH